MGSSEWVEPRLWTREDWRQWRGQVRRSQVIKVPYGLLESLDVILSSAVDKHLLNEPERKHHGALWSLTAAPLCDRRRKPPWTTHEWRDVAVLHESVICEFHIIFRLHERVFWFFSYHLKLWKPFLSCGLSINGGDRSLPSPAVANAQEFKVTSQLIRYKTKEGASLQVSGSTDHLPTVPAKDQVDLGLNFLNRLLIILPMRWFAN